MCMLKNRGRHIPADRPEAPKGRALTKEEHPSLQKCVWRSLSQLCSRIGCWQPRLRYQTRPLLRGGLDQSWDIHSGEGCTLVLKTFCPLCRDSCVSLEKRVERPIIIWPVQRPFIRFFTVYLCIISCFLDAFTPVLVATHCVDSDSSCLHLGFSYGISLTSVTAWALNDCGWPQEDGTS